MIRLDFSMAPHTLHKHKIAGIPVWSGVWLYLCYVIVQAVLHVPAGTEKYLRERVKIIK